ncbi:MAG: diguanylate cyclase [Nitrospinaceae bacterium]|nr:diguanylate cyclase [Nitrospinaceae bacterium]
MTDSLDILVIDDDEGDRMNVQRLLDGEQMNVVIHEASDCSSGIEKMKSIKFDCVLADYRLPDATGVEFLGKLREVDENKVPLIVLTGMGDERLAAEVMKKGASDYLSKNKLHGGNLARSIKNAIQVRSFEKKVRATELALAEREKSYRTIVETVSDVIFRLGPDQKIQFINPAIRFFGYDPAELVGHTIDEFIDVPSNDQEFISKIATQAVGPLATSNLEVNIKETVLDGEGRSIPVLLDAFGLWDVSDEEVFKNNVEKVFLGTLCIARNIMEIKAVEEELLQTQHRLMGMVEELKKIAVLDGLTGIANRRFFDEYSEREWKRAQRDKQSFTVVMIDLDCFKSYNDTYGHQRGDACLKEVAGAINSSMKRPSDLAARYGGEEFVLTLPETDKEGGYKLAEKLRQKIIDLKLEHENNICGNQITISLGVATGIAEPGKLFFDLMVQADKALYEAKRSGRNRTSVFGGETSLNLKTEEK